MSSAEIKELRRLTNEFVDGLQSDYKSVLMALTQKAYKDGLSHAEKSIGKISTTERNKVYESLPDMQTYLVNRIQPAISSIRDDLMSTLNKCISQGMDASKTKIALRKRANFLSEHITFNSVGKTYDAADVINGVLVPTKRTVTRAKTMSTDSYFDIIARDVSKMSYIMAKVNGFREKGYNGFQYRRKRDNKVRKSHRAMGGKKFYIDSPEAKLAYQLLLDYGCRCDITPIKLRSKR